MPSIFSRFADIINSNINSMLDRAENPAKMLKLMIGEMEDTLAEIKAACAQVMAEQARLRRRQNEVREKEDLWRKRAELAAAKDRDDLAREAIVERRSAGAALNELDGQMNEFDMLIEKYRAEIDQLQDKIAQAREKEQLMAHRKSRAEKSLRASGQMRQYDLSAAQLRLEQLDRRLDKLESEADLEFAVRKKETSEHLDREKAFHELDESIDAELRALKKSDK